MAKCGTAAALMIALLVCAVATLLPAVCTADKVIPSAEHHRVVTPDFGPENVTQHSGTLSPPPQIPSGRCIAANSFSAL
jgi:hypothetical protein